MFASSFKAVAAATAGFAARSAMAPKATAAAAASNAFASRCFSVTPSPAVEGSEGGVEVIMHDDGFADVTMNRPEQFNTFNDTLIQRFTDVFQGLKKTEGLRGVFIKSTGKVFSAGADLSWMKRTAGYDRERNLQDAVQLGEMLNTLATLPVPTIALVQGHAFGGGVGLVSCCDISVAASHAKFTLSEVKLGLLPATISPYVIGKIGPNNARRYFLTAEQFDARTARRMGLLQEVVESPDALATMEQHFKKSLGLTAPTAVAASKDLIDAVAGQPITHDLIVDTANRLCDQRASEEGVEGLTAFFEKRKAKWVPSTE